ncbi:MAG TPA: YciI family protein [Pseudomonadales bacterium]|nr:YciI family protein [Pseudomonadales bacterium]
MLYVMYCRDREGAGEIRQANRPAHLEYAKGSTLLQMAGPMLGDDGTTMIGSLFVLEADDLDSVRRFNAEDPYTLAGLFAQVEIHPFRWLLGDGVTTRG